MLEYLPDYLKQRHVQRVVIRANEDTPHGDVEKLVEAMWSDLPNLDISVRESSQWMKRGRVIEALKSLHMAAVSFVVDAKG